MEDYCKVCAGAQGPDHAHVCANCGGDADEGGSTGTAVYYGVDGEEKRFYCDRHCAYMGETEKPDPRHPSVLVNDARLLKVRLAEAGVDWREV